MANVDRDGGLRLVKQAVDQPLELCVIPSGDSKVYGRGDAVKTAGTAVAIGQGPVCKTVVQVAAGDAIYGVIQGVNQVIPGSGMSLDRTHRAASVAQYVYVRTANNSDVYAITSDGTTALVDIGENANLTGNGGGTTITDANTVTGLSTMKLDATSHATGATLQLKMIGVEANGDNALGAASASVLVRLNNVETSGGTGTAGV